LANSDRQHEERLNWLRSLTQQDRDFIARFGEEKWKQFKAMQEFKQISVEESESKKLKESTQARKQRLLAKIEEDILKMEKEYNQDEATIREIWDMWTNTGFLEIMNEIWQESLNQLLIDKPRKKPLSLTVRLDWIPTGKPDEYRIKRGFVSQYVRDNLEKDEDLESQT
jgi:hypothetical protein